MQSQFNRFGLTDNSAYAFVQGVAVREVTYMDLRGMHEDILRQDQSQQVVVDQEKKETFEPLTLKDKAFVHEGEIRGIVMCGLAASSESKGSFMDSAPWMDGDNIYVEIPDDFVESVALDPRCPRYKREVIESYLRDHNVSLALSQAFGYLPDELDFVAPKMRALTNT